MKEKDKGGRPKGSYKIDSKRDKKRKKRIERSIIETEDHAMKKLRQRLDSKGSLNEQEWRSYEHLMEKQRKREVDKVSKSKEVLPEGQLKEWVENAYMMEKILDAAGYPSGKEGIVKALIDANYWICSLCGYSHKIGEECPLILLAKKYKIDLHYKPTEEQIDTMIDKLGIS